MAKNRLEITTRALQIMRVLPVGQAVSAEDADLVSPSVAARELAQARVIDLVADVENDDLDDAFFNAFSTYVAGRYSGDFGIDIQTAIALEDRGKSELITLLNPTRPRARINAERFQ